MIMLLDDSSPLVRRALADVFAASESAPRVIVHALANDQPEIAISILAELTAVKNGVNLPRAVGIAEAKAQAGLVPTGEVCELPASPGPA